MASSADEPDSTRPDEVSVPEPPIRAPFSTSGTSATVSPSKEGGIRLSWTTVSILVTVFLAVCAGLYKVGYDNGSKDLDSYKDSKTFQLPELLSQLGAVSKTTSDRLSKLTYLEGLKDINEELNKKLEGVLNDNARLSNDTKRCSSQVAELLAALKDNIARTERFALVKGASAELFNKTVTLGITAIFESFVDVNFNDHADSWKVGQRENQFCWSAMCNITGKN